MPVSGATRSKAARIFELTALLLVVVSVVQVGWWLYDQRSETTRTVRHVEALHAQQVRAAQALLAAGMSESRVRELLPDVVIESGQARISSDAQAALVENQRRRMNQYAWESAFFLLVLCVCIAVIWRALRTEARVRAEQESFLALVSHQFKTPLASLQLSLETLAMRELPAEHSKRLTERMLADIARMEQLVSQILESARLERGRVELRREPVELAAAVARVVGQLEERARAERITIGTEVPRDLYVLADPISVDVVVRNLVENALAAVAPVGGGSINLRARSANGEVELAVRDSGVGFRPADRTRLFEKFTRLHPGGGSGSLGTGLGLFIVQRLMQLSGGRVSAHSEGIGKGAEFVLVWPRAAAEPDARTEPA